MTVQREQARQISFMFRLADRFRLAGSLFSYVRKPWLALGQQSKLIYQSSQQSQACRVCTVGANSKWWRSQYEKPIYELSQAQIAGVLQ